MNETVVEKMEQEVGQEAETKPKKNPYKMMVKEVYSFTISSEKWIFLCDFALENLQQLYGLWLSTCMAGETLKDRINIGVQFLPSVQKQKDLIEEVAKKQYAAQVEAQQKAQPASGLAVPQGVILKPNKPPTKRGRRGRKQ